MHRWDDKHWADIAQSNLYRLRQEPVLLIDVLTVFELLLI